MKISEQVLGVLRGQVDCDGPLLRIGGERLTPPMYKRVNEVLEGAGGVWSKREQAHVFPGDAAAAVAELLASGEVVTAREIRTAQQYFPTPAAVIDRLLNLADLKVGMEALEPSAGRGAIVEALSNAFCVVDAIELEPEHAQFVKEAGAARSVTVADFLTVPPEPRYDRVVMNPPLTRGTDIVHIRHALGFLRPEGYLISVMTRGNEKSEGVAEFRREVHERGGIFEDLPDGAFTASGTGVRTAIAVIPAGAARGACVFEDARREGYAVEVPAPRQVQRPAAQEEELPPPEVLLKGAQRELRAALRELSQMEKMLAGSGRRSVRAPGSATQEQLTIDGMETA